MPAYRRLLVEGNVRTSRRPADRLHFSAAARILEPMGAVYDPMSGTRSFKFRGAADGCASEGEADRAGSGGRARDQHERLRHGHVGAAREVAAWLGSYEGLRTRREIAASFWKASMNRSGIVARPIFAAVRSHQMDPLERKGSLSGVEYCRERR